MIVRFDRRAAVALGVDGPAAALDSDDAFLVQGRQALAALAGQSGYIAGSFGRAADDPDRWVLVARWASVGAYRRALGAWQVRTDAHPLLFQAVDEPTAYEVLIDDGWSAARPSDRAPDADTAGPGRRSPEDLP